MTEPTQYKGYTLKIEPDQDAESPNTWGNDSLFLVGFNRREFYVERQGFSEGLVTSLLNGCKHEDGSKNDEAHAIAKKYHVFPLEAYIHSGVALYLAGEASTDRQWDVSPLGTVFVSRKEWRTRAQAEEAARSLIAEWNQYLIGDVYTIDILNQDGDTVDSCSGFYGYDDALQSAKEMVNTRLKADKKNPPMYKKDARAILEKNKRTLLCTFHSKVYEQVEKALTIAINNL